MTTPSACELTGKLTDALLDTGIDKDSFSVTYYGASDTKSTNDYRDYRNIILCGKWWLGGSTTKTLERAFGSQGNSGEDYMLWYYVQLLLRIGLRNNDGQTFHVYYTDDHDAGFIARLSLYINKNTLLAKKIKPGKPLWEVLIERHKMGKHYLRNIRTLMNPGLKNAIETEQAYTYTISLPEIATLIPKKKRPQRDNYKGLIRFLAKMNIRLSIVP